jgi:hypothetical protein
MMTGYDCPHDGIQWDVSLYVQEAVTRKKALCIFETQSETPLSRHFDGGAAATYKFYGSQKNTFLTIRGLSAVCCFISILNFIIIFMF